MFSKRKKVNETIETKENNDWSDNEEGKLVVDVYETDRDLVIQAAIAGIKTEELDIALENDMMIIKGERIDPNKSHDKKYFIKECYFGAFSREIILPREIDTSKIKAEIKEGILTIKMPKIERAKSKRINLDEKRSSKNDDSEDEEENDNEEESEEEDTIARPKKRTSKPKKQKEMIYEDEEDMERSESEYDEEENFDDEEN